MSLSTPEAAAYVSDQLALLKLFRIVNVSNLGCGNANANSSLGDSEIVSLGRMPWKLISGAINRSLTAKRAS
jgi:hypothetical protein